MQITDLTPQPVVKPDKVSDQNAKFPKSDLPFYRPLGRTDLTVSCLGLGGGGHISSEDTLYAFEQGINYFFYSSDLHHYLYSSMTDSLRKLCGRGSSVREKVVLATVTYVKNPEAALSALYDQFVELGIDYVDVLFWGWIGSIDEIAFKDCMSISPDIRGPNSVCQRTIERWFGATERMKKMGVVRYVGASFHDLNLAQQWLNSPLLDVVMVRHNVAHRTAQNLVFPHLDAKDPQRPGIVTFKSAGSHTGALWHPPASLPKECWRPSVPDLYRYSLSQNSVDVCLTGLTKREQIDDAIAGVGQGKLTPAELDYLSVYGDLHRNRLKIKDVSSDQLLYRTNTASISPQTTSPEQDNYETNDGSNTIGLPTGIATSGNFSGNG